MHFSPSIALALAALAIGATANSGYASTCNSIQLPSGKPVYLFADCRKPDGSYTVSNNIELDKCFGNSGGNLVGQAK